MLLSQSISERTSGTALGLSEPTPSRFGRAESGVTSCDAADDPAPRRWRELHTCVAMLLESACGIQVPTEKRSHRRYPFRRPLTITPVIEQSGRPDRVQSFPAFGFDISSAGISFLARQLLPSRKAVVTCDGFDDRPVNLLFEPRWVRFTRGGWYQTGGRLLEVLPDDTVPAPSLRLIDVPPELIEGSSSQQSHLRTPRF